MKKVILIILIALFVPVTASAFTREQLQQQLSDLLGAVTRLQEQRGNSTGDNPNTNPSTDSSSNTSADTKLVINEMNENNKSVSWSISGAETVQGWWINITCAEVAVTFDGSRNLCGTTYYPTQAEAINYRPFIFTLTNPAVEGYITFELVTIYPFGGRKVHTKGVVVRATSTSNTPGQVLNVQSSPLFNTSEYGVGMRASWSPVKSASEYRVTHIRHDIEGGSEQVQKTKSLTFSSGTFPNAGAPKYCYYHKLMVEALDFRGKVITSETVSLCEIGRSPTQASSYSDGNENMANALQAAEGFLRSLLNR